MAPGTFLQAYVQATTEEFRESSHAPKIDAKNPAGESRSPISGRLVCAVHLNGPITEAVIKQCPEKKHWKSAELYFESVPDKCVT